MDKEDTNIIPQGEDIKKGRGPKGQSISFWLTTSLIFSVSLVSVISIFMNYMDIKQKSQADLLKDLEQNISALAGILQIPLWTYDQETIENVGSLYAGNENIVVLTIVDSLGKALFHIEKEDHSKQVFRTQKVMFDGKLAGTFRIALSTKKYQEAIRQILWSGIMTMVINLSVLILITGFLLRLFLAKPLGMLSEIVNSYALGNYETPMPQLPYIEFQPAVDVIRSMGTKITRQIEELKQAEKKFRSIFENAVEGIFQLDVKGRFINANPSFASILGYDSPEDLMGSVTYVGKQCFENKEDFKKVIDALEFKNTVTGIEVRGIKKNGDVFWVSLSARTVKDEHNKILFFEGSIIDISDRKEKEEAEKKQKAADVANQAKTLFLARMSHELRTPLNSVLGMTEMLKETNLSDDQVEYIKLLQSSGEFLESIINDILDFSKIEAQQIIFDEIPFQLEKIIQDVVDIVSIKARNKNLVIKTTVDPNIYPVLKGDPIRLKQILVNIAGNAVKFTQRGLVEIDVKKITAQKENQGVENILFKISDTGIGIPESKLESIFESFTQVDSVVKQNYGGTGLGLSICKRLVDLMGGTLKVESIEGEGATFSVMLGFPVAEEDIAEDQKFMIHKDQKLPNLSILLVDDIEPNRTVIHKFLKYAPVTIINAEDGQKALELFDEKKFDLILMDVEMPVMGGLEATRLIRQREREKKLPETPLIILSAHAFGEQRKQCYEAGCNDLLVKPIRKNDLITAIHSLFSKDTPPPKPKYDSNENGADENGIRGNGINSTYKVVIDAMFEDLLDDFFKYFKESIESMDRAITEQNYDHLYRLGHGLKGSSRNYEFYKLGDIFFEIEKAAADKNMDDAVFYLSLARDFLDHVDVEFVDKG